MPECSLEEQQSMNEFQRKVWWVCRGLGAVSVTIGLGATMANGNVFWLLGASIVLATSVAISLWITRKTSTPKVHRYEEVLRAVEEWCRQLELSTGREVSERDFEMLLGREQWLTFEKLLRTQGTEEFDPSLRRRIIKILGRELGEDEGIKISGEITTVTVGGEDAPQPREANVSTNFTNFPIQSAEGSRLVHAQA